MTHVANGHAKEVLEKVRTLYRERRFSDALRLVMDNKTLVASSPDLLAIKGNLILLDEDVGVFEPTDALACYEKALDIDPNNVDAILESGWYNLNIANNSADALIFFERAIELLSIESDEYSIATAGKVYCIAERESTSAAIMFLENAQLSTVDKSNILQTLAETYA